MINIKKPVDIAYNFLLLNNIKSFPINPLPLLRRSNITLDSIQQYSIIMDVPFNTAIMRGKAQDGYVISAKKGSQSATLILYDQDSTLENKLWTIFHEVGHVLLGHKEDGDTQEAETNLFVREVFMSRPILTAIEERGYILTPNLIYDTFHVPDEAARRRIETLHAGKEVIHPLDEALRANFADFLNSNFPDFYGGGGATATQRLRVIK